MNANAQQGLVLLAEDNEDDAFFFERAFRKAGFENPLRIVRDGVEVVDYLTGTGEYADLQDHPFPSLLLLDLNMGRRNGLEVLEWLEQPGVRQSLIVVVLTSSVSAADVSAAYARGANSYLVKPVELHQMMQLAELIGTYWLRANRPPSAPGPSRTLEPAAGRR
jgi:CheY-like chemotaxis protein